MGERGPAPKRESQRRRVNKPTLPVKRAVGGTSERKPAKRGWHPIAKHWYQSLADAGQSAFYQASDWNTAYAVAESMSREFKPQPLVVGDRVQMVELPPRASSLQAWLKAAASLCATEGDRRRAGIELDRDGDDDEAAGDVSWFDDARRRLRESS